MYQKIAAPSWSSFTKLLQEDHKLIEINEIVDAINAIEQASATLNPGEQLPISLLLSITAALEAGGAGEIGAELLAIAALHEPYKALLWRELGLLRLRLGNEAGATEALQKLIAIGVDENDIEAVIALTRLARKHNLQSNSSLLTQTHKTRSSLKSSPNQAAPLRPDYRLIPYKGTGSAPRILILQSIHGGNIRLDHTITSDYCTAIYTSTEKLSHASFKALPTHDLIFNGIGDPDSSLMALERASNLTTSSTIPLLNRPEKVLGTGRATVPARLTGLPNILVPDVVRVPRTLLASQDIESTIAGLGLSFPLLLRPPGFHSGQHFYKAERAQDIISALKDGAFDEWLLINYIDYRNKDGLYRKYRAFFIDGNIYPYHLAISDNWKIHYFSAIMAGQPEHKKEEASFLSSISSSLSPKIFDALQEIEQRMGLDFCGVDFGISPDNGDVIVFECNAEMFVYPENPSSEFTYRCQPVETIIKAFRTMIMRYALI